MENNETPRIKTTINVMAARQFVTVLQSSMIFDMFGPVLKAAGGNAQLRFHLLEQANLSNLYGFASLVTDKNEALAEYDRLTDMVAAGQGADSTGVIALRNSRPTFVELLSNTDRGH